jgi:hypothetical protein
MKANRSIRDNEDGYDTPMGSAILVVVAISLMFIGAFFCGILNISLTNTFPTATSRTPIQNMSVKRMTNVSKTTDSVYGILNINIIIYVLGAALATIIGAFAFGVGRRSGQ